MDSLYPYYVRAAAGDGEAFARDFPYLFLVHRPDSEDEDDEGSAGAVDDASDTGEIRLRPEKSTGHSSAPPNAGGTDYSVAAIRKRPGFAPFNRVVVGRIGSCDVVIAHPSVSKSHAQFHLGENRSASLSDRRSARGTFVNGRQLEPDEVVPVRAGDRVRFGKVELDVVDAAALYRMLRAL